MEAALRVLTGGEVGFRETEARDGVAYLAHTVSRTGTFLSREAGIREGEPLAYLIAPPVEAMTAMDAALKAADVRLAKLWEPRCQTLPCTAWTSPKTLCVWPPGSTNPAPGSAAPLPISPFHRKAWT